MGDQTSNTGGSWNGLFGDSISGWNGLFGGSGGGGSGGMSPTQMMYAMALMNSGNQQQGSGGSGGSANNAGSSILRAMMLSRMMNAGQGQQPQQMTGYAPSMQPGQSGTGGFVAPYGPSSQGYSQSGAGAIGGNAQMFSNPYSMTPSTAGAIAPASGSGGVGASPGVSTVSNPYGSYGYGYSNPYGISGQTPSY